MKIRFENWNNSFIDQSKHYRSWNLHFNEMAERLSAVTNSRQLTKIKWRQGHGDRQRFGEVVDPWKANVGCDSGNAKGEHVYSVGNMKEAYSTISIPC